jgi:uncharacterized protein (TIGR02996 family)
VGELSAFLEAIRRRRGNDTPRLVFADWLDENHPNLTIRRGDLPKGFNAHWHEHVMYATLGVREARRGRGKWSNPDILAGLTASKKTLQSEDISGWAVRVGAAEVGDYPVIVSEPQMKQDRALAVCRALQWAAGCPVSFNRCPQPWRLRIALWFTAMASPEQQLRELADLVNAACSDVAWGVAQPDPKASKGKRK